MPDNLTLEDILPDLRELHKQRYIETERTGDTAVGYTLEERLGVVENNESDSDLENTEIKAVRRDSSSPTTLLCREPPTQELWGTELVEAVGVEDEEGRLDLYSTIISDQTNPDGFSLGFYEDSFCVEHEVLGMCGRYPANFMRQAFEGKFQNLLYVLAESEDRAGTEWFWYKKAYLLRGLEGDAFMQLLRDGDVVVDLRRHLKPDATSERNHGTAFRIRSKDKLINAFEQAEPVFDSESLDTTELSSIERQSRIDDY